MDSIVNGVLSGLFLALLIGPVFFTLIQTSIEKGFRSGVFVAIGVSLSDAFYITLSYLGIYQIFNNQEFLKYLAYCGGGVLMVFGFYYVFIKNRKLSRLAEEVRVTSPVRLVAKGFIINGLTPMVLLFWIGTISFATSEFGYSTPGKAIPYFAAIVVTVFTTDVIKAKLADRLRVVLTQRFIRILNIVLGIAMIIFGTRLILNAGNLTALVQKNRSAVSAPEVHR
jgi:threonine/homoserine/homoserine lactone efflux protein